MDVDPLDTPPEEQPSKFEKHFCVFVLFSMIVVLVMLVIIVIAGQLNLECPGLKKILPMLSSIEALVIMLVLKLAILAFSLLNQDHPSHDQVNYQLIVSTKRVEVTLQNMISKFVAYDSSTVLFGGCRVRSCHELFYRASSDNKMNTVN
ncbi:hypothetical protein FGLOB1_7968 [Fusarium globosum]|uniref:Uncharacterized protein n=1 Tax=Fusarium globosum TaxID=78864 RepID=A0A8H5Y5N8_9HYPO|nr:hypothetical protein FGLOB1_7968 [Fusarium globosum]